MKNQTNTLLLAIAIGAFPIANSVYGAVISYGPGSALGPVDYTVANGTTINDALTTTASAYSYFLVGITHRAGLTGSDLNDVDLTIDGGASIQMFELANGGNSNGNAEIWGVAVDGIGVTSDVDFTFDYAATESWPIGLSFIQVTSTQPIILLDSDAGAPDATLTLTETIGVDDFVLAVQGNRDTSSTILEWTGSIGAPTDFNTIVNGVQGNGKESHAYWDNVSGTGLTISSNLNNVNGGLAAVALTTVPEPSTYALLLGFAALGGILLRRRRNA